jgi:transcriptional regulator NrdR family protein
MTTETQNNDKNKNPVDQAVDQLQESFLKDIKSKLKTKTEEYVKSKKLTSSILVELKDLVEEHDVAKLEYLALKKELKA